eukprot:GILK01009373.1.p1 GENE.GILK01009373.1~~GILK01009373.1.p1  ORF type:complete len:488 (+),score=32.46 GILK01009373.1:72-1535(+)
MPSNYESIRRILHDRKAADADIVQQVFEDRCFGGEYARRRNYIVNHLHKKREPVPASRPAVTNAATAAPVVAPARSSSLVDVNGQAAVDLQIEVAKQLGLEYTKPVATRPPRFGDRIDNNAIQLAHEAMKKKRDWLEAEREEMYNFAGMHYVYGQHSEPVVTLRFARENPDQLGMASMDGTISICRVLHEKKVIRTLKGHTKGVTDLDWASCNDYLVSASNDKTLRVWKTSSGKCLRIIYGDTEWTAVRFHPSNDNLFVAGNMKGLLRTYNVSTGRHQFETKCSGAVTTIEFDHTGNNIFVGDAAGYIYAFTTRRSPNSVSHQLKSTFKKSTTPMFTKADVINSLTFMSWHTCFSSPALLAHCKDGFIRVYSLIERRRESIGGSVSPRSAGYSGIALQRQIPIDTQFYKSKSIFCARGAFIVSASEDQNVYIYDIFEEPSRVVNRLSGHGSPCLAVCWNQHESLLATSDSSGMVIIWKRVKIASDDS